MVDFPTYSIPYKNLKSLVPLILLKTLELTHFLPNPVNSAYLH